MRRKILITGGHLSPALAVISELKKRGDWQIFFLGRKYPLEGDKAISLEWREVRKLAIPFFILKTGRLQRKFTFYTVLSLFKIPFGLVQSFLILFKIKPDIILSFGGYLAVPVSIAGWFLQIPIVTHEQTMSAGLANRLIALFAQKICLSWPETVKNFPKEKVVLTGNPVRKEIFTLHATRDPEPEHRSTRTEFGTRQGVRFRAGTRHAEDEDLPLIYITGGSLGAHSINKVVKQILPQLLKKYRVIHQCGDSQVYRDYKQLQATRNKIDVKLKKRYHLTKFVESEDIGWVLNNADLIISRAGANTITELLTLGKPAILIPLPWAGGDEQAQNAQLMKKIGLAEILPQEKLTGQSLYQCIELLIQNLEKYKKNAEKGKKLVKLDAIAEIVDILENLV